MLDEEQSEFKKTMGRYGLPKWAQYAALSFAVLFVFVFAFIIITGIIIFGMAIWIKVVG